MPDESNNKLTPPYLPYRTFISSLDKFAEGVPPRIDRGIWKNQTGSIQSLIMGAYRFLGLIDDQNKPTDTLRYLVEHRDKPTDSVKAILEEKYAGVIKHNLATMTEALISEYFEKVFGVEGDTKRKCITFFLQAAKAVGMPLSAFLQSQVRVRTSGTRRRRRDEGDNEPEEMENEDLIQQAGEAKTIELRSGGTLTLSASVKFFDLGSEDRTFVFELLDKLRDYSVVPQKAQAGGK
ncbi:MAG: DUF5343 domain-containing protein [Candidatus Sulfotelmatobacter sp.]